MGSIKASKGARGQCVGLSVRIQSLVVANRIDVSYFAKAQTLYGSAIAHDRRQGDLAMYCDHACFDFADLSRFFDFSHN